jgi:serine/threonine-protein kinase
VGSPRSLVWVNRAGQETPITGVPKRSYQYPRLSPDNSRVALSIDDQEQDIWVLDLAVQTLTRATFSPGLDAMAAWYPDGQRFLFASGRDGVPNLYAQRADGTGAAERITKSDVPQFIPTLSPDGTLVVALEQRAGTGNDLVLVRLGGATGGSRGSGATSPGELKSEPLVATQFTEALPEISPDGRWLAYVSNDSGTPQIIVQPFPQVSGGRWQVSTEGGTRPAWSPTGKELFFAAPNGAIMAVSFDDGPAFKVLKTVKLFDWPTLSVPGPGRTYDVTRDGQRFLMIKEGDSDKPQAAAATLRVVLNWTEELKGKLPPK